VQLRLPLVAGIVALAAGAAVWRTGGTLRPPPPPSIARPSSISVSTSRVSGPTVDRSPTGDARVPQHRALTAAGSVVYVAGDVVRPGLYTLPARSRAADAVRAAGGARPDADLVAINLAAPVSDGDEVIVSAQGVPRTPSQRRTRRASGASAPGVAGATTHCKPRGHKKRHATHAAPIAEVPNDIVDLNHADASELELLPGIGSGLAERIVTMRETNGPFTSADDLLDVGGMTQARLDALLPYVVVR